MSNLVQQLEAPIWRNPQEIDLFKDVVESIISQQLSVKAADIITERVYNLLPNKLVKPQFILEMEIESLRACGISYAKARYLRSAATAAIAKEVDFEKLPELSDEAVIAELTKIHGVGKWTAEMLLIFSLQRPDIFSLGDLGLRTAVSNLYHVERNNLKAIEEISAQWSPYRSLASRYLWLSLANTPK